MAVIEVPATSRIAAMSSTVRRRTPIRYSASAAAGSAHELSPTVAASSRWAAVCSRPGRRNRSGPMASVAITPIRASMTYIPTKPSGG